MLLSKSKNIELNGITKSPIIVSYNKIKEDLEKNNELNYILECVYTQVLHNLSFKRTSKNESYVLLDNIIDKNIKCVIEIDDLNEIMSGRYNKFKLKKVKKIMGIPKLYITEHPLITNKPNISKYMASKYKEAFYVPRDYLMNRLAFNLFTSKNEEKLLKYSEGLYDEINKYLNNNKYLYGGKKDEELEKVINTMDEMFLIAPLSEDDMVIYRGYHTSRLNLSNELGDNIKLGTQKGYMSTTTDPYLAYEYVVGSKIFDDLLVFIGLMLLTTQYTPTLMSGISSYSTAFYSTYEKLYDNTKNLLDEKVVELAQYSAEQYEILKNLGNEYLKLTSDKLTYVLSLPKSLLDKVSKINLNYDEIKKFAELRMNEIKNMQNFTSDQIKILLGLSSSYLNKMLLLPKPLIDKLSQIDFSLKDLNKLLEIPLNNIKKLQMFGLEQIDILLELKTNILNKLLGLPSDVMKKINEILIMAVEIDYGKHIEYIIIQLLKIGVEKIKKMAIEKILSEIALAIRGGSVKNDNKIKKKKSIGGTLGSEVKKVKENKISDFVLPSISVLVEKILKSEGYKKCSLFLEKSLGLKNMFMEKILKMIPEHFNAILLQSVTAFLIYKKLRRLCCFVVMHLDDGIPYLELDKLSKNKNEILLPRGVSIKHVKTETDYQIKLGALHGYGNFFELIGVNSVITAHHVQVSMSDELKSKYAKKEKCIEYDLYKINLVE